jgi:hypothetical protein
MPRIPVSGSSSDRFIRWADVEEGDEFEGTFRGYREGRFGLLADLAMADETVTLPVNAALERELNRVKVGAHVVIVYNGLKPSKKRPGKSFHSFSVFVTEQADLLPVRRGATAPRTTYEVPF